MELYLLHPILVHFPIAILILGFAVGSISLCRNHPEGLSEAASWLLWMGAASVWMAVGAGLLAQKTAPHIPLAWETLAEHKELGLWTAGLFTALSLWRFWMKRRWEKIFFLAWLASLGLLLATAFHGGELVFTFGMGVQK